MTHDQDVQFYDRQGRAITRDEARDLIRQNLDHVARSTVTDAADWTQSSVVSTIWVGGDVELGDYPQPMIFQTAVFDANGKRIDIIPSATEEHAMQAHRTMVEEHSKNMVDPVVVDILATDS
ncbi:hypothetical protein AB4Z09_27300 [Rhodococcus sp. TAF43]|uniref:hypothetical protein n=1 Tax=Rhodococcus sp. TAF43 TaxID=3237483 RepID=UPI003F9BED20